MITFKQFMTKQPLYVSRKLLNGGQFVAWAKSQGFDNTLDPNDLHVTIVYSKQPVDWSAVRPQLSTLLFAGTGPGPLDQAIRSVQAFDGGACVLQFTSSLLRSRWYAWREAGASWDYEEYTPHITITYDGTNVDLDTVVPYDGPIELGQEELEPLDEDAV